MKSKSEFSIIFLTKILLVVSLATAAKSALADYRKALDYLQKTQPMDMMEEIEDAVKTNNIDGLSIFIGTLSDRLTNNEFFILTANGDKFYLNGSENTKSLLLGKNQIPKLMGFLEKSTSTADMETQFDFAILKSKFNNAENRSNLTDTELEKFSSYGVRKAIDILASKKIEEESDKNQFNLSLKKRFDVIKESANLGNNDSALRLAIVYLRWLPYEQHPDRVFFNVIPQNDTEGILWLKRYASNSNSTDINFIGPCKLADEYYSGRVLKKDSNQAFLWYVQSAKNTAGLPEECSINGLREMASSGDLNPIDSKFVTLLKDNKTNPIQAYIQKLSLELEAPSDLTQFKNPVNRDILYSVKESRYSLKVYKDGKVNFEGYSPNSSFSPEARLSISSYIVGRDEWLISNETLKDLTEQLNTLNLNKVPDHIVESALCDTGENWRYGQVTINTSSTIKTIDYVTLGHTFNTPALAKIFKIQEDFVPTQKLRCGLNRKDHNYKKCVNEDEWNINLANENI